MPAPQTLLISIVCADDSVAVMAFVVKELHPATGVIMWEREPSYEAITSEIERASASFDADKMPIKSWRIIERDDIPADRTYRNALRDNGKKLQHNMPHARELHRELLRSERREVFPVMDGEYLKALDTGDSVARQAVARKKQGLRDAPAHPAIEAAKTVEQLKTLTLDKLSE
jgi:hypothetical protein